MRTVVTIVSPESVAALVKENERLAARWEIEHAANLKLLEERDDYRERYNFESECNSEFIAEIDNLKAEIAQLKGGGRE